LFACLKKHTFLQGATTSTNEAEYIDDPLYRQPTALLHTTLPTKKSTSTGGSLTFDPRKWAPFVMSRVDACVHFDNKMRKNARIVSKK